MPTTQPHELLLDSEVTLRLVGEAVAEELRALGSTPAPAHASDSAGSVPELSMLSDLLLRTYGEISSVVQSLRESRGMLQKAAVEKLHHTNEKLREVTSATEVAATDIMDSVDRALALVDEMETDDGAARGAELRGSVRDELFGVMNHLQFQDITTQQLNHASSILDEMERRLDQIASLFDPQALGMPDPGPMIPLGPVTFDPAATTQGAEIRQAAVDELFGS